MKRHGIAVDDSRVEIALRNIPYLSILHILGGDSTVYDNNVRLLETNNGTCFREELDNTSVKPKKKLNYPIRFLT